MRSAKALALLSANLALTTFAFTIPQGQSAGVYLVQTYPNGTEVQQRITDPAPPYNLSAPLYNLSSPLYNVSPPMAKGRRARDIPQPAWAKNFWPTECFGDEPTIDITDHDTSLAMLLGQFPAHQQVGNGLNLYSTYGHAVSYACMANANAQYGTPVATRALMAIMWVELSCGGYQYPGHTLDEDSGFLYGVENWLTTEGKEFCVGDITPTSEPVGK